MGGRRRTGPLCTHSKLSSHSARERDRTNPASHPANTQIRIHAPTALALSLLSYTSASLRCAASWHAFASSSRLQPYREAAGRPAAAHVQGADSHLLRCTPPPDVAPTVDSGGHPLRATCPPGCSCRFIPESQLHSVHSLQPLLLLRRHAGLQGCCRIRRRRLCAQAWQGREGRWRGASNPAAAAPSTCLPIGNGPPRPALLLRAPVWPPSSLSCGRGRPGAGTGQGMSAWGGTSCVEAAPQDAASSVQTRRPYRSHIVLVKHFPQLLAVSGDYSVASPTCQPAQSTCSPAVAPQNSEPAAGLLPLRQAAANTSCGGWQRLRRRALEWCPELGRRLQVSSKPRGGDTRTRTAHLHKAEHVVALRRAPRHAKLLQHKGLAHGGGGGDVGPHPLAEPGRASKW